MKALPAIAVLGVLVVGCASHGTWSRSDRGAWETLGTMIGQNDKAYYLGKWGEPLARQYTYANTGDGMGTINGEELLWLWKTDGTGPSDQRGQGWELFLELDNPGKVSNWRIGTFRTSLTPADAIAVSRKFQYRFDEDLIKELGLSEEQHGISQDLRGKGQRLCEIYESCLFNRARLDEIIQRQNEVHVLTAATFEADTVARNLHGRLATEGEVLALLEAYLGRQQGVSLDQRRLGAMDAAMSEGGDLTYGGLLGRRFLGPYTPNAYGPGINSDATGRPFMWQPQWGGTGYPDPTLRVAPNAYGLGVGMDQYGRPVRPACPPGWAGPC